MNGVYIPHSFSLASHFQVCTPINTMAQAVGVLGMYL